MKNQMYTLGRAGIRVLAALALFAGLNSCSDDFTLDEEKPEWLGESIYAWLQQKGNFKNYLQLMTDIGQQEILSRTGSRTILAADDEAFQAFYAKNATLPASNPWHTATSYAKLSAAQKSLLGMTSMLNNAITMEDLSTSQSVNGATKRGLYLRRPTLVTVDDSITYYRSNQLPYSYNKEDEDYWADFRSFTYTHGMGVVSDDGNGDGVMLTNGDGTSNMILCFTTEQMANNQVQESDFELVMGVKDRDRTDVYVNDTKIVKKDQVCQNGYVDVTSKVLTPLPDMAELIRTNGSTNIFSHILDRFAVPVYVKYYNELYKTSHPGFNGKIFSWWYISDPGFSGFSNTSASAYHDLENRVRNTVTQETENSQKKIKIPTGEGAADFKYIIPSDKYGSYSLKFNPAWNACDIKFGGAGQDVPEQDMLAMFVPDDETMLASCHTGVLRLLLEEYAPDMIGQVDAATLDDTESLFQALDQIPMSRLQKIINNLMQTTYNNSVESKFRTLKNDAQDPLFGDNTEVTVKRVELACNGAVYILGTFHASADFYSVAAPVFIKSDKKVMYFAIYNGETDNETNYMRLNYYAYLKAMQSRFSLFIPDDEAMAYNYNPMSFKTKYPRAIGLKRTEDGTGMPIAYDVKWYVPERAEMPPMTNPGAYRDVALTNDDRVGFLKDILNTHTIVHESSSELMTGNDKNRYYVTKGNDAIKVTRNPSNGQVIGVQGGFQLENERRGYTQAGRDPGIVMCNVKGQPSLYSEDTHRNGDSYTIDAPIVAASQTVYDLIDPSNEFIPAPAEFSEFFDLCTAKNSYDYSIDDMLRAAGMYLTVDDEGMEEEMTALEESNTLDLYSIFYWPGGENGASLSQNVSFFNAYQYTVFVPKSGVLSSEMRQKGVPTWEQIAQQIYEATTFSVDESGSQQMPVISDIVVRNKIKAQIIYLTNFIRLHFMDESVFADNESWGQAQDKSTSCYYAVTDANTGVESGNYMKLRINRTGNGGMTVQPLDAASQKNTVLTANVIGEDGVTNNLMAREIICTNSRGEMKSIHGLDNKGLNDLSISTSSAAVVHLIDHVLMFQDNAPDFDKESFVRRYLRNNRVVNSNK